MNPLSRSTVTAARPEAGVDSSDGVLRPESSLSAAAGAACRTTVPATGEGAFGARFSSCHPVHKEQAMPGTGVWPSGFPS